VVWTLNHSTCKGKEKKKLLYDPHIWQLTEYYPFIYIKVVTIDSALWNIIVCTSEAQPSSLCLETPWIEHWGPHFCSCFVITSLAFTSMWSYFFSFTEDPNVSLLSQTSKFRANGTFWGQLFVLWKVVVLTQEPGLWFNQSKLLRHTCTKYIYIYIKREE
jgi:hypothetical protein